MSSNPFHGVSLITILYHPLVGDYTAFAVYIALLVYRMQPDYNLNLLNRIRIDVFNS